MNKHEYEDYEMEIEHKILSIFESELWSSRIQLEAEEHRFLDCSAALKAKPDCKFHLKRLAHSENEYGRMQARIDLVKKLARQRSHYFYLGEDGLIEIGLGVFY